MYYGDLENTLHEWVQEKRDSVFVIDGPSQVGKTYFIEHFLQYEGLNHIYVDVKENKDLLERILDNSSNNANDFYTALCLELNKSTFKPVVLLVFDGIEYCPKLRQFFKTLVSHPKINILAISCGGLGPLHYKTLLIPSEENVFHMQPLNFYDFLVEIGQNTLGEYLKGSINYKQPLSEYLSNKIYSLFKLYNLVGGYPSALSLFNNEGDIDYCIEENKKIFAKQFEHALSLLNDEDKLLLLKIRDNFASLITSGKYNCIDGISTYKMKQLLSFIEEEHVINIATALDVQNQSNLSNAKKVLFSHQCFYHAICGFNRTNYLDEIDVDYQVVLTDFFFNQRKNNKQLNFALERSTRYFVSDALIVNNTSIYIVEIKNKRLSVESNKNISLKSDGTFKPGVLLLNSNKFKFDSVFVLPSYCSCFLNVLFDK
ncbi:MAG: ATP-binding protein [Bacilli bacterium]|nr:ATP-binding protein [Bacilli bacterium]